MAWLSHTNSDSFTLWSQGQHVSCLCVHMGDFAHGKTLVFSLFLLSAARLCCAWSDCFCFQLPDSAVRDLIVFAFSCQTLLCVIWLFLLAAARLCCAWSDCFCFQLPDSAVRDLIVFAFSCQTLLCVIWLFLLAAARLCCAWSDCGIHCFEVHPIQLRVLCQKWAGWWLDSSAGLVYLWFLLFTRDFFVSRLFLIQLCQLGEGCLTKVFSVASVVNIKAAGYPRPCFWQFAAETHPFFWFCACISLMLQLGNKRWDLNT